MTHENRGFLRILMTLVMIATMFGGMYIPQAPPAGAQDAAATPVGLAEDEPDPPAPSGSVTVTVLDSVTGLPVTTAHVNDVLKVTVSIANTGDVSLSNLHITSSVFASGPSPVIELEPAESTSQDYSYTVTSADLTAGSKAFEFSVSSDEISQIDGAVTISVIEPASPTEVPTEPAPSETPIDPEPTEGPVDPEPTSNPTEPPATPIVPTPDPEANGSLNIRAKDSASGAPADFCIDINIAGDDYYYCAVGIDPPEIDLPELPVGTYDILVSPNNGPGFDPTLVEDVVVASDAPVNLLVDVESTVPDLGMEARISLSVVYPEMAFPGDVVTITFVADSGAFLVGDLTVSATVGGGDPVSCLIPGLASYSSGRCSVEYTVLSNESAPAIGVAAQVTSAILPAAISLYEEFLIGQPITLRVQALDQMASLVPGACFDIQNWAEGIGIFDQCEPTGEFVLVDAPPGEYIVSARTADGEISSNTWLYLAPGSGESVASLLLSLPETSGFVQGNIEIYGAPDFEVGETIEAVFVLRYSGYVPLRNVRIEMDSEVFRQTCERPSVISSTLCYWVWTPTAVDVGRSEIVTVTVTADDLDEPLVLPFLVRVLPTDDNTPIGAPVQIFPYGMPAAWVTFEQVDTAGRTSYARTDHFGAMTFDPLFPGAFGRVYELVTTAEYTGSFELCQPYWKSDFGDPRLLWWDGSIWLELGSTILPGSGEEGTICATAPETGIFAVVNASNAFPPYADTLEVTVPAGEPTSIDVLEKVTDEDTPRGDLTVALHPSTMPTLGTVEIDPEDPQRVIYTTLGNSLGFDYFAVQVSDGVHTTFAWVYVTIAGPHTLSMTLTDPTGYAPALVRVELYQVTDDGEQFVREQEVSAIEPQVIDFTGLVAGEYRYAVLSNLYEGADHGEGTVTVGNEPITSIDVQIGVDPNFGWLIVRSLDEDGTHLVPGGCWLLALEDGNYVRCDRPETEARVGIAGYYRVPVGEWELSQYDFGAPGGFAPASPRTVIIQAGQVTVVSIAYEPAEVLEIVGVDTLGFPVTGYCVQVFVGEDWLFSRCDDEDGLADGLITFPRLDAGSYRVVINPGWNETRILETNSFPFTVASDGAVDAGGGGNQLTVLFQAGGRAIVSVNAVAAMTNLCVALVQHDPSGASAPVVLFGEENTCGYAWPMWDHALQEYIVPAHSIDLMQIPAGEYTIVMLTHGVSIVSGATLVVPPGETVNHAITVEAVAGPRSLVMADVFDADGNPATHVEAGDEIEVRLRFFNTGTVVLTNPAWSSPALGAGAVGTAIFAPSVHGRTEVTRYTVTAADVEDGQFEIDIAFTADGLSAPVMTQVVLTVEGYVPPTETPTPEPTETPTPEPTETPTPEPTGTPTEVPTEESATPEPATPEPATPEPATPEPATPEPATPEPATPEPATPEPATPEPGTPEPATPEPVIPAVTLSKDRATPGSSVDWTIEGFTPGSNLMLTWQSPSGASLPLGSAVVGENGRASGALTVPTVPGGAGYLVRFSTGPTESVAHGFEVASRIAITPSRAVPGQIVSVNLRGFTASETVSLRWKVGSTWIAAGTTSTNSNGSRSNISLMVPASAPSGSIILRVDGTISQQTSALTIIKPTATLTPVRATVGTSIAFTLTDFPADSGVTITWRRLNGAIVNIGTAQTDAGGSATGAFDVPTVDGGPGQQVIFTAGATSATASFEIAPRIRIVPTTVRPGDTISMNLRGFTRNDPVTIYWMNDQGALVPVSTATTNGNGNVTGHEIVVPTWAPNGVNKIRVDGVIDQQTSALTVQRPTVTVDRTSGTPGVSVGYEIANFPVNSVVSITWRRLSGSTIDLGTVTADANGNASGSFKIPATPGGPGQIVTFAVGSVSATATLEVKPRIKVTPATAGRGETIDISLRGFARQEAVVIRWRPGASGPFQTITGGTTSNTGSANISFTVPATAADGPYQVRAESASFNQQTSAFAVAGGQPVVLAAVDAGEPPPTGDLPSAIWLAGAPAVVRRAKPWRGRRLPV